MAQEFMDFASALVPPEGAGSSKKAKVKTTGLKVSSKVCTQATKDGWASAQITIPDGFGPHRGEMVFRLPAELCGTEKDCRVSLTKGGDTHALWFSHQSPETRRVFQQCFMLLGSPENRDRSHGSVISPDATTTAATKKLKLWD